MQSLVQHSEDRSQNNLAAPRSSGWELAVLLAVAIAVSSGVSPVFSHDRVAAETLAIDSGNPLLSLFGSLAALIPFGALPARVDLALATPMLLAAFWLSRAAGEGLAHRVGAMLWAAACLACVAPKDSLALAAFAYSLTRAPNAFAAMSLWAMGAFSSPILALFFALMRAIGPRAPTPEPTEKNVRSVYSFWGALVVVMLVAGFWIARRRLHAWIFDSWSSTLLSYPAVPASSAQIVVHALVIALSVVTAIAAKRSLVRVLATTLLALAAWALRQPAWLFLASALAASEVALASQRAQTASTPNPQSAFRRAGSAIALSVWIALSIAFFERQIAPESSLATADYLQLSQLALAPPHALFATDSQLRFRASALAQMGVRPDVDTLPIGPYLRQDSRSIAERMSAEDPQVELLLRALILNGKLDSLTLSTFTEHRSLVTDLAPRAWSDISANALQTPLGLEIRGERVAPSERKLAPYAPLIAADSELCAGSSLAECADFASQKAAFDAVLDHHADPTKSPAMPTHLRK
jgi:hypothetical protein